MERKPRVIIIGAGLSGLSAARHLHSRAASLDITLLEASQRTGGRIFTSRFSGSGEQIEIGATWIHGIEGSPLYETAVKSGALEGDVAFECMDGFPEPPIVKAHGGIVVNKAIAHNIASLYKQLVADVNDMRGVPGGVEKLEHGNAPNLGSYLRGRLESYLQKHGKNTALELLLEQDNPGLITPGSTWDLESLQDGVFTIQENWERCVTGADSLHDLNLQVFNEYWEFPGEQITIARGFSSLVQAIAGSFPPESIKFGKHVERIVWSDQGAPSKSRCPVQLHCGDGSVYEADHVIVTVSLGVLKARKRLFQPALPPWKLDSIHKLGYGLVDKLFVLMEPLPEGSKHPNLQMIHRGDSREVPRWLRKTHSMYPIHKNSNVLVAWFAGNEAKELETLSDEEIAKGVQKTLVAFGDRRRVAGVHRVANGKEVSDVSLAHGSWGQNPLFLGSYSYVAVGSSGEDIDLLAEPVPRENDSASSPPPLQLLFAGEATHREQYSTTHGAYFSGIREADRLLEHYNITTS